MVRVAAWDEDTTLTFTQSVDGNSGDSRVYADEASRGIPVEALRLDGLASISGTTLSVVKTDLQGRDHRALAGLRKTLERDRPVIVTEFWPAGIRDAGDDPLDVLDQYTDMGYERQSLPGQPTLPDHPSKVLAMAEAAEGGFLTLALTPTVTAPR